MSMSTFVLIPLGVFQRDAGYGVNARFIGDAGLVEIGREAGLVGYGIWRECGIGRMRDW